MTRLTRLYLWQIFAEKIAADLLFHVGRRYAGCRFADLCDRAGIRLYERAYAALAGLVRKWEARP